MLLQSSFVPSSPSETVSTNIVKSTPSESLSSVEISIHSRTTQGLSVSSSTKGTVSPKDYYPSTSTTNLSPQGHSTQSTILDLGSTSYPPHETELTTTNFNLISEEGTTSVELSTQSRKIQPHSVFSSTENVASTKTHFETTAEGILTFGNSKESGPIESRSVTYSPMGVASESVRSTSSSSEDVSLDDLSMVSREEFPYI